MRVASAAGEPRSVETQHGADIAGAKPCHQSVETRVALDWTPIRYRNVISVLKNPFYAGAFIYLKSEHRTAIVNGRPQKTYGHGKAFVDWEVVFKDHH